MTGLPIASPHHVNVMSLMSSIRGCAALVVAAVHAFQVFVLPYFGLYGVPHLATSWLATYAVMAFFIVSGFMIFMSVSRHRQADGAFDLPGFLRARFFRIYPPLVAAVVLSAGVYFIIHGLDLHGATSFRLGGELFLSRERVVFEWDRVLPTLLLAYNVVPSMPPPLSINGPLWTLAYEWWFYMFAAAACALVARRSSVRWVFLGGLLLLFYVQPSGDLFWALFIVWHAGFLLGFLYMRDALDSRYFWPASVLLVSLCIAGIFLASQGEPLKYVVEPLQRLGNRAHFTMMFVSLIMTVTLAAAIRAKLAGRMFAAAAGYSYTLYLVHFPLLLLAFSLLHPLVHAKGWVVSGAAGLLSLFLIVPVSARLAGVVENRALAAAVVRRLGGRS